MVQRLEEVGWVDRSYFLRSKNDSSYPTGLTDKAPINGCVFKDQIHSFACLADIRNPKTELKGERIGNIQDWFRQKSYRVSFYTS